MNGEDIYNGMTDIRDDQIDNANMTPGKRRPRRLRWMACAAAFLAVVLVAVTFSDLWGTTGNSFVIAATDYPEQEQYSEENWDAWYRENRARLQYSSAYADTLNGFMRAVIPELLAATEGENRVCSPLNIYMALSMLTEITEQNSREQIMNLLDCNDIEEVRSRADAVWNANYIDDGSVTSRLANSLWLNEDLDFVQETLETLAQTYHASSYHGEMGSDAYSQALKTWIDENTGGRLSEQTSLLKLHPQTILALVSTIYYRARWADEFLTESTSEEVFHVPNGEQTIDFMHQTMNGSYDRGLQFSAVSKRLQNSGHMLFILPDEGVSPEDLLADDEVLDYLLSHGFWNNSKYARINLSIPKFDVACSMDLIEPLKTLGVTDVFDSVTADFSPMLPASDACVSQAEHAARVTIDEEGCEAAAYVIMAVEESADESNEPEEVNFILDRPFLFAITGDDGSLLFTGIVNQP